MGVFCCGSMGWIWMICCCFCCWRMVVFGLILMLLCGCWLGWVGCGGWLWCCVWFCVGCVIVFIGCWYVIVIVGLVVRMVVFC